MKLSITAFLPLTIIKNHLNFEEAQKIESCRTQ